ncbi:uncharacterized protein LOC144826808 [Lissotriton helveticus]
MSADTLRGRMEMSKGMFSDPPAGESTTSPILNAAPEQRSEIKELFKRLEKCSKGEQAKWWEFTSLSGYLEVGRVPRGLRTVLAPSYEDPDPQMLADWAQCNFENSKRLMGILVQYAESDRAKLLEKIDSINAEIDKIPPSAEISKLRDDMNTRLKREEDIIMKRKAYKFQRDRLDYENGKIFTFAKKYDKIKQRQATNNSNTSNTTATINANTATTNGGVSQTYSGSGDGNCTAGSKGKSTLCSTGCRRQRNNKQRAERRKCNKRRKTRCQAKETALQKAVELTTINAVSSATTAEQGDVDTKAVINLSDIVLTTKETSILSLGLSYSPKGNFDYATTKVDIFKFVRKLKLRKYFAARVGPDHNSSHSMPVTAPILSVPSDAGDTIITGAALTQEFYELQQEELCPITESQTALGGEPLPNACPTHFKTKSKFCPLMLKDNVDIFHDRVTSQLKELQIRTANSIKRHTYRDREYHTLIKKLRDNKNLVIRQSDKGGNVVLWPRKMYLEEAHKQLNDRDCYRRISLQEAMQTRNAIYLKLSAWRSKGLISMDEYKFLKKDYPVMPVIYFIPKVHKNLVQPPGRPIISACNSLLENMSRYIDFFLQDFVRGLPSFILDTSDFLRKLQDFVWSPNYVLVSMDVTSLYTSIIHTDCLKATQHFLDKRDIGFQEHSKMLFDMITICLENNIFLFANQLFLQTRGVAMGACFSPSYACLHMGYWEEQVLMKQHADTMTAKVKLWLRYIDDLLFVWDGTEDEVVKFIETLNVNNSNIHFTSTHSKSSIVFLDVEVFVHAGKLQTRLHRKPTAGNTLLHADSQHPAHLIRSIPYGEMLRIRRICSNDYDCRLAQSLCKARFMERGYRVETIDNAIMRANKIDRITLLGSGSVRPKIPTDKVGEETRLIMTYNNQHKSIHKIVKDNWFLVSSDPIIGSQMCKQPSITYRKARAMQDSLVSSSPEVAPGSWLSGSKGFLRCSICKACKHGISKT